MTKPARADYRLSLMVIFILVSGAWSCTQERQPCLTPKTASMNIECVHRLSDSNYVFIDSVLPKALFTAITAGAPRSFLYTAPSSVFALSLSPLTDTCSWIMAIDSTYVTPFDTLTFYYQRQLKFISNACGYTYFYSLDSLHHTTNQIDSVFITNPNVTNNANVTKQLKIHIKHNY